MSFFELKEKKAPGTLKELQKVLIEYPNCIPAILYDRCFTKASQGSGYRYSDNYRIDCARLALLYLPIEATIMGVDLNEKFCEQGVKA